MEFPKSSKGIHELLKKELLAIYPEGEAAEISYRVMEYFFDLNKTEIIIDTPFISWEPRLQKDLTYCLKRLLKSEPVQYVLGETEFYGRPFFLDRSTLIPRPEIEELVDIIVKEYKGIKGLNILDIGTGSGCIPITLEQELDCEEVYGMDVSEEALKVAVDNAEETRSRVQFFQGDILKGKFNIVEEAFDIIVSNPPYVTEKEKEQMRENVLNYEPHLALFVENDNPLIFYKAITEFAKKHLKKGGKLYVEINEAYGKETAALLERFDTVEVVKDMFGKDRFVKGVK